MGIFNKSSLDLRETLHQQIFKVRTRNHLFFSLHIRKMTYATLMFPVFKYPKAIGVFRKLKSLNSLDSYLQCDIHLIFVENTF